MIVLRRWPVRLAILGVVVVSSVAIAQESQSPQQLFEAGQWDRALQLIAGQREGGTAGPPETYLAAQVLMKANRSAGARGEFETLTKSDDEAWRLIGESGMAAIDQNDQRALEAATRAAELSPDRFEAHYQLGYARARVGDWTGSAAALERATELNPLFAYAHYNAGQAYSKMGRVDRTAEYFERFLKLAPSAPERPAVESLMRTLRGR
jgi:tetratricopeptide (TPR) repeat protein